MKDQPIELDFNVNAYFGTHDREESGDVPLAIISKEEKEIELSHASETWQEITPGVEVMYTLSYFEKSRESQYRLRIQPSACPLLIQARKFHENSSSDYPHHGESSETYYSILVKKH